MEISNYKHKIIEVVKFHQLDLLGICNNVVYFDYFVDARIKYIQNLKAIYKFKEFLEGNSFFIMAQNECDYIEPAYLDDELNIYTRIDFIKNSSFGLRHLIEKESSKKIIAHGGGIVVHIDRYSKKPLQLPEEFYDAVKKFENKVEVLRTT